MMRYAGILVLCVYICTCRGGCVAFNKASAPINYDICAPYVDDFVYSNYPLFVTDFVANQTLFPLRKMYPITPLACSRMVLLLVCRTAFPPCGSQFVEDLNTTEVFGRPICRSVCEATNLACQSFFASISYNSSFGCSKNNSQWPVSSRNTTIGGVLVEISCNSSIEYANSSFLFDFGQCLYPLVIAPAPKPSDAPCQSPCPTPTYTDQQYAATIFTGNFLSAVSLVLAGFTTITFLLSPIRRKHPANLQIFLFISIIVFHISILLNGNAPQRNVWCRDAVSKNRMTDSPVNYTCMIQGILFVQFVLSTCFWCAVISMNLFVRIYTNGRFNSAVLVKYYHMIAWGIPLAMVVTALGGKSFSYSDGVLWCFVNAGGLLNLNKVKVDIVLFFIPLGFSIFLAVFFFLATSKLLFSHHMRVRKQAGQKQVSFFGLKWRILFFCFTIAAIFTILIAFRVYLDGSSKAIRDGDVPWVACKYKAAAGLGDLKNCPGSVLPVMYILSLLFLYLFLWQILSF